MKTPGVYIVEKTAFPNSVVEVATAVPAFVGYTEMAQQGGHSVLMTPRRIASFAEFIEYFGGPPQQVFKISGTAAADVLPAASYNITGQEKFLAPTRPGFCLYAAIRWFFVNGGGACYIVSVGSYSAPRIAQDALVAGIEALKKEPEPTMLVVPESTRLSGAADRPELSAAFGEGHSAQVHQKMLAHCGEEMKDRFAILDMHRGFLPEEGAQDPITLFRDGLGAGALDYGACYYPWLNTTVFDGSDISVAAIEPASRVELAADLKASLARPDPDAIAQIERLLAPGFLPPGSPEAKPEHSPAPLTSRLEAGDGYSFADADPVRLLNAMGVVVEGLDLQTAEGGWTLTPDGGGGYAVSFVPHPSFEGRAELPVLLSKLSDPTETAPAALEPELRRLEITVERSETSRLDKALRAVCPAYADVMQAIATYLGALPPGAAMAGIYTAVDTTRGVWKAPAGVSVNAVVGPMVDVDEQAQEGLNASTTGKSINAIRPFVGEGTMVWGARTLDGNSLDWRYINVRRMIIMIEQSIQLACKAYVFEPNTASTWATMRAMIENFLTGVWKQGGLAGAAPTDAFGVRIGLGETMTADDILEGVLRVEVFVAVVRPAEFIVITFAQQMQKS